MRHGALSSRAVLALSTAALVAITSGATALVVLTGTATLVGLDDALDPRPAVRAGDALPVVELPVAVPLRTGGSGSTGATGSGSRPGPSRGTAPLTGLPGFRTPGAPLISRLPGAGLVGFAPQLPGSVPLASPPGVLDQVPVARAVVDPTGSVLAQPSGPVVPTATDRSEKSGRLPKSTTVAAPTTPTLALVQPRLVTALPTPVAVDAQDRAAAALTSAAKTPAVEKSATRKAVTKKAATKKVSAGKPAVKSGQGTVARPVAGAAKKALAR